MSTPPTCHCGRFAVGVCQTCGEYVCEQHSDPGPELRCARHRIEAERLRIDLEQRELADLRRELADEARAFVTAMQRLDAPGAVLARSDSGRVRLWPTHTHRRTAEPTVYGDRRADAAEITEHWAITPEGVWMQVHKERILGVTQYRVAGRRTLRATDGEWPGGAHRGMLRALADAHGG